MTTQNNLPALCEHLHLRADGRVPIVNSRDVAAEFDKRHANVLRDIDDLFVTNSNLSSLNWFREVSYIDEKGEARRSVDLTRDGFTLLVQGWTGPKALDFKIRYIQAFNQMEELLNSRPDITTHEQFIAAIREIVRPLAIRFDDQDRAIDRVEDKVDDLGAKVISLEDNVQEIKHHLKGKIRAAGKKHESVLVYVVNRFYGGKCPVSGVQLLDSVCRLIKDERGKPLGEIEHFYGVDIPSLANFWLVAKDINEGLRTGRLPRHSIEPHFRAFQEKLKVALGGKIIEFPKPKQPQQPTLF